MIQFRFSTFFLLLSFAFLAACTQQENSEEATADYDFYFDFEEEANRLGRQNQEVTKLIVDGSAEDSIVVEPDWENELALFIDADINKLRLKDSYRREETNESSRKTISLEAIDAELEVTQVAHYFREDRLEKVQIKVQKSDFLRGSSYELSYFPDSLYLIKAKIEVPYLLEKNLEIEARFNN